MKTTIFTIALVLSLGTAFSQESEKVTLPNTKHAINTKGTGGNRMQNLESPEGELIENIINGTPIKGIIIKGGKSEI
jgi:hypothetical protein